MFTADQAELCGIDVEELGSELTTNFFMHFAAPLMYLRHNQYVKPN